MNMIWHQAIDRAPEMESIGGMRHDFTKSKMEFRVQPASISMFQCQRPEDVGITLVVDWIQTREIAFRDKGHERLYLVGNEDGNCAGKARFHAVRRALFS
jgi:hypothetical protein